MTTKATCPSWCIEGEGCEGEHESDLLARVPATGGLPRFSAYGGFSFPGANLRLYYSLVDHTPPHVALHIGGEDVDQQADMQLHEARALHAELGRAIDLLAGGGSAEAAAAERTCAPWCRPDLAEHDYEDQHGHNRICGTGSSTYVAGDLSLAVSVERHATPEGQARDVVWVESDQVDVVDAEAFALALLRAIGSPLLDETEVSA